jgi:hypothetical protein
MSKQTIPSEAEIRSTYPFLVGAVLLLFQRTFTELNERLQEVEDRLSKNSGNSGKAALHRRV